MFQVDASEAHVRLESLQHCLIEHSPQNVRIDNEHRLAFRFQQALQMRKHFDTRRGPAQGRTELMRQKLMGFRIREGEVKRLVELGQHFT